MKKLFGLFLVGVSAPVLTLMYSAGGLLSGTQGSDSSDPSLASSSTITLTELDLEEKMFKKVSKWQKQLDLVEELLLRDIIRAENKKKAERGRYLTLKDAERVIAEVRKMPLSSRSSTTSLVFQAPRVKTTPKAPAPAPARTFKETSSKPQYGTSWDDYEGPGF